MMINSAHSIKPRLSVILVVLVLLISLGAG
jgi:hypothetical protein